MKRINKYVLDSLQVTSQVGLAMTNYKLPLNRYKLVYIELSVTYDDCTPFTPR